MGAPFYLPWAKSEREVDDPTERSLDKVRPPLPLSPPIPLPKQRRFWQPPPLLDEWLGRLPNVLIIAGASGLLTGFIKGRQTRSLRWTAENSHRKPGTKAGWYTYRKQKNYAVFTAGMAAGLRTAGRYCAFTTSFILLEAAAEHVLLLNERWRHSRKTKAGAQEWWGADFWAKPDAAAMPGGALGQTREEELRSDLRMAGGGAIAGGLMITTGGLYNRWFPPVIRRFALFAVLAGGTHGFFFSYAARDAARELAKKEALLGVEGELLESILPTSIERVRQDEDETRRTLEAWAMAAELDACALQAEQTSARPTKAGWRAWLSSGSTDEEHKVPQT